MQDHRDDVLADVVYVALDGGNHDLALGFGGDAGLLFFELLFDFDERNQVGHGLFHHACRLDHLRQKHLALAEQIANDVHAIHQRAFDHVDRPAAVGQQLLARFFGVFDDPLRDAVDQRVRQPLLHRAVAPFEVLFFFLVTGFQGAGDLDHAFGGIVAAVQHDVFDALAQLGRQLAVDAHHAGVDDAHRHAGLDCVVQEYRVDRFACRVVAAEAEADVRDTAADFGVRQILADPACRVDEVDRVIVVLFDAGGDRKNVRVEDDVFRRKADFRHQQVVGALADFGLARERIGLAFFIEGHHDHGRTVAAAQTGLAQEFILAFFHRNRVHDRLALHAFQARFDDRPLRRIDHDRYAGDVRLGRYQMQEARHRGDRIEHRFVHVDVDDLCAVFDLLAGDGDGFVVLLVEDQARESFRAGHVGALADVHEQRIVIDDERLETRQAHHLRDGGNLARRDAGDGLRNRADMVRRGAAAAAGDVDEAAFCEVFQQRRGHVRGFIETGIAHRVRQAGIRVNADESVGDLRQFFGIRTHQCGAECAVQAYRHWSCMAHRIPECRHGLARQNAARCIGDGT
ncbi:hypothetical protein IMCC9480_1254 [Oxalobacteraceae bacterium IMCC9480]|nr:hypothetical protein IMCC9480_1254 [Oxalobacteraceae bacterium IMCC9480]